LNTSLKNKKISKKYKKNSLKVWNDNYLKSRKKKRFNYNLKEEKKNGYKIKKSNKKKKKKIEKYIIMK
jgi:hypothetical protein